MQEAFIAERIFTGEKWLTGHAILTTDKKIQALLPMDSLPADAEVRNFDQCFIAPSFIDLQIYGAGGKLLAMHPEPDALMRLNEYCRSGGAALCMPTVATNSYQVFYDCIDAIRKYWNEGGAGVMGLHIEGPWINPVKRGAHIEAFIHRPTLDRVNELLEYGKGVIRIITLAPEVCDAAIIERILSEGILISAGHSNSSYAEAKLGFSRGIKAVTHLYNAMSPLQHRAPGLVGASMDDEQVMASIIPDGHHVDFAALRIAKEVMKERLFVITDAVTETKDGPYPHKLVGDKYESDGILSGSALTMNEAVKRLVENAGIELDEALRMCSVYPAKLIGASEHISKIEVGRRLSVVVMNDAFDVIELID